MVLTFSQLLISLPSGFQQIMRPSLQATLIILNSTSMLQVVLYRLYFQCASMVILFVVLNGDDAIAVGMY